MRGTPRDGICALVREGETPEPPFSTWRDGSGFCPVLTRGRGTLTLSPGEPHPFWFVHWEVAWVKGRDLLDTKQLEVPTAPLLAPPYILPEFLGDSLAYTPRPLCPG